jgi:zeaxanthin glucosyltransferase
VTTKGQQACILPRNDAPSPALCITHAGLNTALECLTEGVRMVAIPVTNDQPGVAARVEHSKTGKFISLQNLTSSSLKVLVREALLNPEYRQNAVRLQRTILAGRGLDLAVVLLEQAFGIVPASAEHSIRGPVSK